NSQHNRYCLEGRESARVEGGCRQSRRERVVPSAAETCGMQFAESGQYIRSAASTRSVRFFFFAEAMVRIHVTSAVVLFCLSIGLLCPSRLVAQGLFGTISGTVTDSSGAVVVGA